MYFLKYANIMQEKDTQMVLASSSFENATKVRFRD
jgi:hypothetical protein